MEMKDYLKQKPLSDFYTALENFKLHLRQIDITLDSKSRFEKIEEFWKKEIGFFVFLAHEQEVLPTSSFYRVRINDGSINYGLIQEFSTPPVSLTKSFQRVNIPNNPVFYAGLSMDVAVFETLHHPQHLNKEFYLSKWKVKNKVDTIATHFLFKETINSDLNNAANHLSKSTEHIYQDLSSEEKEFVNKYTEMIIKEFLNESSYMLSSYVGHENLYAKHNYRSSLLFYPSIRKKHHGINVAMNPNFVVQNLELDTIYYCKNIETTETNIQIKFFNIGKVFGPSIMWAKMTDEDFEKVNKEFNS